MYNNVIKSGDFNAFEKLNENYDHIKNRQDYMTKVNDYFKENGTVVGCPGVESDVATSLDAKIREGQELPYPQSFFDTNKETLQMLQNMMNRIADKPETLFKGWQFAGGEAVVNLANNRLQLMFNEKPSDEVIASLKQNGFHWARTQGAWQRPLTHQTMSVADKLGYIKAIDGRKPTDLQPKAPKRNEPER